MYVHIYMRVHVAGTRIGGEGVEEEAVRRRHDRCERPVPAPPFSI